jgi:hypothetical protein
MVYSGWDYKREHSLTSATELTDYQVKILVSYSSGTSSGDTVYLDGKCKADFGDIRFADSDNNELSYWIESVSGTLATIWVKIPTINTTTIWIYYGNESASTTSSGDTTFILFDHFDGSSINSSKWTVEKKGSASAIAQVNGSSILQLSGENGVSSSANLISVSTFAQPFVLEIQEQITVTNGAYAGTSFGLTTTLQDSDNAGSNWWITILGNSYAFTTAGYNSKGVMFRSPLGGIYVSFGLMSGKIFPAANTYYRNRYIKTSTGIQFIRDGISYGTATDATYTGPFYICINQGEDSGGSSYAGYRYIDYILVRNYSATEPTHGEWSEEILNKIDFESLYNVGEFVSFVSLYFVGESVDFSSKYNIEWLVDFVLKYHIEIETAFESIYKIKTDHNFTTCITSNDKKSTEFRTRVESVRSSAIRFEMT